MGFKWPIVKQYYPATKNRLKSQILSQKITKINPLLSDLLPNPNIITQSQLRLMCWQLSTWILCFPTLLELVVTYRQLLFGTMSIYICNRPYTANDSSYDIASNTLVDARVYITRYWGNVECWMTDKIHCTNDTYARRWRNTSLQATVGLLVFTVFKYTIITVTSWAVCPSPAARPHL